LPTTSNNSISGSWDGPISTATPGTITYTFTPDAGQCATTTTMDVVINDNTIIPTFTQLGPYCPGETADILPTTSNNSISGSWDGPISTATPGTITYTFTPDAGQCATTTTMDVVINDNTIIPTFTPLGPYCSGETADLLPTTSNNSINGSWDGSISTATPGTITYTFTPDAGQCATTATMDVVVVENEVPTFTQLGPYCVGATPDVLPVISNNGINGSWNTNVSTATPGTITYTFTPDAGLCATIATMVVVVVENEAPTFTQLGPYCVGEVPGILPSTSINGIGGSWDGPISTVVAGTYTYTFIPDLGVCATTTTMNVVIESPVTPTFTAIPDVCQNAPAPALLATSLNGISGTWSPAVSTANAGTTTYTFTPNANECANTTTLNITVIENVVPQFNAVADVCQGAPAPGLPTTSLNGINGTWSSAVSTATPGTFTYTFTPNSGVCATIATIQITVLDPMIPQFNTIAPICQGTLAPTLPTTSLNGINGTWSPAVSTATPGTFTYTFTPNTGICATTATLEITVTDAITPLFSAVSTLCLNAPAPALPTISNNGIIGSWDRPVTTDATGTTTYFFTPDPGQCAVGTSLNVSVTNPVTPTFATIGDICQGTSAPNLPVVSLNGITGVWNPSTINSALAGTTTHTFTPNPNQCAESISVDIVVVAPVVPDFELFEPVCQGYGTQLPLISLNGVSGSWTPAVVTEFPGTFSYVFVPSGNQCALQVSAELEVLPSDSSIIQDFTCFASEAGESITIFSNQQGCDSVVTTVTTLLSNGYAVFPDFVSIRAGESFEFIINNEDNNLEFSWISTDGQTCNPPCQSYLVTATNDITNYYFTFVDTSTGCVNNDTMRVKLEYFSELNVPNIFTPNNDGQNDVYRVYGTDLFDFSLMIFDRWGGKVFETTDINEGWDGNFKGQPLQSGVYVALIQATGLDTKKYEIKQNIKLVR
jgi:gliding motility-associated-like protein